MNELEWIDGADDEYSPDEYAENGDFSAELIHFTNDPVTQVTVSFDFPTEKAKEICKMILALVNS